TYLEPELVERIRQTLPGLTLLYDADLLYQPRYVADHIGPSEWRRTPEQEERFLSWLAEADIMWDFDRRLTPRLTELAPRLKWIQATSSGIGVTVKESGLDRSSITITNA